MGSGNDVAIIAVVVVCRDVASAKRLLLVRIPQQRAERPARHASLPTHRSRQDEGRPEVRRAVGLDDTLDGLADRRGAPQQQHFVLGSQAVPAPRTQCGVGCIGHGRFGHERRQRRSLGGARDGVEAQRVRQPRLGAAKKEDERIAHARREPCDRVQQRGAVGRRLALVAHNGAHTFIVERQQRAASA
eukprot:6718664-Prymnesium_polylepis.1